MWRLQVPVCPLVPPAPRPGRRRHVGEHPPFLFIKGNFVPSTVSDAQEVLPKHLRIKEGKK